MFSWLVEMWPNDGPGEKACHEAGHAVARYKLGVPFSQVIASPEITRVESGDPLPDFLDTDFSVPETLADARKTHWRPEARVLVRRFMVAAAAGPLAQMQCEDRELPEAIANFHLFGGSDDAACLRGFASVLACHECAEDNEVPKIADAIMREVLAEAGLLVRAEAIAIAHVAAMLLQNSKLSAAEVAALLNKED